MDQLTLGQKRRPDPAPRGHISARPDERRSAALLALQMLHGIRNPLEALNYLVFLAGQQSDDPQQQHFLALAEQNLSTLTRIASQTLHFAELSDGPHPIDLVDLAESALRLHQQTIESRQIHLVKDLPRGLLAGVHRGQMLHVISHLIVNALESLDPEGTLSMRLRKRRDGLHLLIADNGRGIPAEHHQQLFDPSFVQIGEGHAWGSLALARQIVEDHHGRLTMRSSTRQGRTGTAFKIYLPLHVEQA